MQRTRPNWRLRGAAGAFALVGLGASVAACGDVPSGSLSEHLHKGSNAAAPEASTGATDRPAVATPDAGAAQPSIPKGDVDAGASEIDAGPPSHRLLVASYPSEIVELSTEGAVTWKHTTPGLAVFVQPLANGNVFYPFHGAITGAEEVDRQQKVVWSFTSAAQEVIGGERLANGNTLLGEEGPPVAREINGQGGAVSALPLTTSEAEAHHQVRQIHKLPNGNLLIAFEGEGAVREVSPQGQTVWEYKGVTSVFSAQRLSNGNTLIGGGTSKRVVEVTPAGAVAWEFSDADAPTLGIAWITSVQVLAKGHLLVGNWLGGNGGTGVHAFEVTRDKKVVWTLDDHVNIKSATAVTALGE